MPRKTRSLLVGEQHHVVIKGHNGESIRSDPSDAARLLSMLAAAFAATGARCACSRGLSSPITCISSSRAPSKCSRAPCTTRSRPTPNCATQKSAGEAESSSTASGRTLSRDEAYQLAAFIYTLLNPLKAARWHRDLQMETLDAIIEVVCARHAILPATLLRGSRDATSVLARREIAARAITLLDATDAQLARALNLSRPAIAFITKPLRIRVK